MYLSLSATNLFKRAANYVVSQKASLVQHGFVKKIFSSYASANGQIARFAQSSLVTNHSVALIAGGVILGALAIGKVWKKYAALKERLDLNDCFTSALSQLAKELETENKKYKSENETITQGREELLCEYTKVHDQLTNFIRRTEFLGSALEKKLESVREEERSTLLQEHFEITQRLKASIASLSADLEYLKRKHEETIQRIGAQENEILVLSSSFQKAQDDLQTEKWQVERFQMRLVEAQRENQTITQNREEVFREYTKVCDKLNDLISRTEFLESALEKSESVRKEEGSRLLEEHSEIRKRLEASIASLNADLECLKRKHEETIQRIGAQEKEILMLSSSLKKAKEDLMIKEMQFKDQNTRLVLLVDSLTRSHKDVRPYTTPPRRGMITSPGSISRRVFSPATEAALDRVRANAKKGATEGAS
jgi:hypothetical protein